MSKDAEVTGNEVPLEDFGRFTPVETQDSDDNITDESYYDEAYAEETAGA